MASAVAESSPPLSRTTTGRARSDATLGSPDQNVKPRRKPESMGATPRRDEGHSLELLVASHPERHQDDTFRGQGILGPKLEDLVEITRIGDDELEPGAQVAEALDGQRPESSRERHAGVSELEGNVPLIDGRERWRLGAGGLDLDAEPEALESRHERDEGRVFERLTTGHDDVEGPGDFDLG